MSNDLPLVPAPLQYDQTIWQRVLTVLQQTFADYTSVKFAAQNAANLLASNVTPVSNVSTGATDLMKYEVVPNTIARIGTRVSIYAFGTFATNAHNKEVKFYLGSTLIGDSTSQAANGGNWSFSAELTVTATDVEQVITNFNSDNISFTNSINYVMASETLSAILTIKVTGTGTASADITQNGLSVTVYPMNPLL